MAFSGESDTTTKTEDERQMHKTIIRYTLLILYFVAFFAIIYAIFGGSWIDILFAQPYYAYAGTLFAVSLFCMLLVLRKANNLTPSAVLFLFFIAGPILGPPGLQIYETLFNLSGVNTEQSFPVFVWAVGTAALLLGVLIAHYVCKGPVSSRARFWHERYASLLLWSCLAVAAFFTLFVIFRLGYIPLLHASIDEVRGEFHLSAGEYPLKLSRLWLAAVPLAATFAAFRTRNRVYFAIVLVCSLALVIYGQRTYMLLAITTALLIYVKIRRVKYLHVAILGGSLVVLFLLYAEFRAGRSFKELSTSELIVMNSFREWREYTFFVNETRESQEFYGEDFFTGALLPVLPKQVWAVVGVDKNKLMLEKSAAHILGRELDEGLGIRIGTIGEAYMGFGLFHGVVLQMLVFGLIFGWLELYYLRLDQRDARLALVSFALSLLLYLPIATLITTLSIAVFFGFFLILFHFIGTYRVHLDHSLQHHEPRITQTVTT